jgi:YVTN family beta-propeller protein
VGPGRSTRTGLDRGGTYQVVRIIQMLLDKWNTVPVGEQERIFGRRKVSGAPLYVTSQTDTDNFDPVYTNDPQGLLTPLNSHIRLGNPQTPQTAATSAVLRRSYQAAKRQPRTPPSSAVRVGVGIVLVLVTGFLIAACAPAVAPGPAPADRFVCVTDQLDNTLPVIDGGSYKVIATVPVGTSPAGVVVSPDGKQAYVANTGDSTVSVLNNGTNTVATTAALPAGSSPMGLVLSPNGQFLYVADGGSNSASVVDTRTNAVTASVPVGSQPVGVAIASDGASVYVTNEVSPNVMVINARSGAVEATLRAASPFNVVTSPNGSRFTYPISVRASSPSSTPGAAKSRRPSPSVHRAPIPSTQRSPTRAPARCPSSTPAHSTWWPRSRPAPAPSASRSCSPGREQVGVSFAARDGDN